MMAVRHRKRFSYEVYAVSQSFSKSVTLSIFITSSVPSSLSMYNDKTHSDQSRNEEDRRYSGNAFKRVF